MGRKRCTFNENYFKDWNPENSYILGYLFADGCVVKRKTGKYVTKLQASCVDEPLVSAITQRLQSTYQISIVRPRGYSEVAKQPKCSVRHELPSNTLAEHLIQKGCHPRKSLTLQWPPSIPHAMISQFVLGYFDGDGSIGIYRGHLRISFYGTNMFLSELQKQIKVCANLKFNGHFYQYATNCWNLHYDGTQNPLQVYNWMYQHADMQMILKRKQIVGQFFKTVLHLSEKQRQIEWDNFKSTNTEYQQLMQCQIPPCKCAKQ